MDFGGKPLFQHLDLNLTAGERVGIVGRNGLGKSTLVKLILGELKPVAGEILIGAQTQINYVDQTRSRLDDTKSVWQEVEESVRLRGPDRCHDQPERHREGEDPTHRHPRADIRSSSRQQEDR